jgi:hypothetical protein
MSELTDELNAALMEQRDAWNFVFGVMRRTENKLLEVLAKMEQRHPLDPNTMSEEALGTLAEHLWNRTSLKATVEATIDTLVESAVDEAISELSVDVDRIDLTIRR